MPHWSPSTPPVDTNPAINRLTRLAKLPYRLFGLRHGQSLANREGIISSHPRFDIDRYGLTCEGMFQVRVAIRGAMEAGILSKETLILCSPFLRTRESADIAATLLGASSPIIDGRLRERDFGELNGKSTERYDEVWQLDRHNSANRGFAGESADQVMFRMTDFALDLCRHAAGRTVLVVSHGDPLNILNTALTRKPADIHREGNTFVPGELRELALASPRATLLEPAQIRIGTAQAL